MVHRLVFEDREDRFRAIEERMARTIQIGAAQSVEDARVGLLGELMDLLARRPARSTTGSPQDGSRGRLRLRCDSWGSIPRAKIVSSRASMLGPPSAFFTSVLKLNPGRWPS